MEKVVNFRQLGGIPLKDGGTVKNGIFYRAAELDFASENDIEELKKLGLKAIFDFRDQSEKTNPEIYDKLGVKYYNVPIRAENAKIVKLRIKPDLKTLLSLNGGDVCEIYAELPFSNPGFEKFFGIIKDGEFPLLFHCTAGKDRTGVSAALLLALLGADRGDILKDYLETKKAVPLIKAAILRNVNFLLRGFVGKRMQPLFDVEAEYLAAALDAVYNKYGSIEAYFKAEHNYSDTDIDRIKKLCRE
ncbi:MAG: tyrosine-protein phosphatase [Clostridiales bacterium]|jgi:protein-tyrosine phosphatase|nr:tyrosine-protein phosphatase [Clostridiales bacterium]